MKKLGMMTMLALCSVVVLGLAGSASAYVWWDGGPSGTGTDWSVAANWEGDALPLATDNPAIGVASLTAGSGGLGAVGLLPMPVVSTDMSGTEYA